MTIIYSINSLVNDAPNILCEIKHKFYVYQNSNFIFIKKYEQKRTKNMIT